MSSDTVLHRISCCPICPLIYERRLAHGEKLNPSIFLIYLPFPPSLHQLHCLFYYCLGFLIFDVTTAVVLLSLGPVIGSLVNGQNYQRGRRISVRVGAALISLLYKKSLSVDLCALGQGIGAVNNLISVDMKEIQEFACFVQYLWSTVFEASICLVLLFFILGPAALGGISVMLVAIPIGSYGTIKLDDYQTRLLKDKDNRISVVQEAIQGIRVVKWFAWEDQFMEKISVARLKEISSLRSYLIADALLKINWGLVPTLVGLVSFLVHTMVLGKSLSPSVGFTSILLFNLLRWPVTIFPDMVNSLVRARVSMRRIEEFLNAKNVTGLCHLKGQEEALSREVSDRNDNIDGVIATKVKNQDPIQTEVEGRKYRDKMGMHSLGYDLSVEVDESSATVTLNNASFGWSIQSRVYGDDGDDDRAMIIKKKKKKEGWARLNRFKFRGISTNSNISVTGGSDSEYHGSDSDDDKDMDKGDVGTERKKKYSGPWASR